MNYILGVVKRNPLFLHEIEWKNNGFLFTTPNIILFLKPKALIFLTNDWNINIKKLIIINFNIEYKLKNKKYM